MCEIYSFLPRFMTAFYRVWKLECMSEGSNMNDPPNTPTKDISPFQVLSNGTLWIMGFSMPRGADPSGLAFWGIWSELDSLGFYISFKGRKT